MDDEAAMQIRQSTSAVTYALVLLPLMGGWGAAIDVMRSSAMPFIALAAVLGTSSYIFYYKAIAVLGAQEAMALNITYSAWAIPFSMLIVGTVPVLRDVMCHVDHRGCRVGGDRCDDALPKGRHGVDAYR